MTTQLAVAGVTLLSLSPGCNQDHPDEEIEHHEEHGGSEEIVVRLDRHKVFHAGIRLESVAKRSIPVPLTLPAKVNFNEKRLAHVTARVGGRVEKVNAFTNDKVRGGDTLLQLSSQEFLAMQFEFLQALQRWSSSQKESAEKQAHARSLYESARAKLIAVGLDEEDLNKLEATQASSNYYNVQAPFDGIVLLSSIKTGEQVEIGTDLFELADLRTLWVLADVYEKDLRYINAGMKAVVEVDAYPDLWNGTVSSVYGVVDEKTRTVKARIEVDNSNGKLKPGMFCTVKIHTELGKETIKVPASALLGETEKHFVFVAINDTTFEKRDVLTGAETRDFAEILDGLLEEEKIVVKGGFFLKSELAKETFGEEH